MGSNTHTLDELTLRLSTAASADEEALFHEAAHLLLPDAATFDADRLSQLIRLKAFHEGAVGLYRLALPGHGFQFGMPPPLADGTGARPIAIAWRRGDSASIPYRAATPALALLAAAAGEAAKARETGARAACSSCFGLGWYLARDNTKMLCRSCRD
jgi:hypothetical protein